VRQLDTGLLSYVQDWDERYPPGEHWAEGIGPYTRSPSLFKCPSDEREPSYAFNQALSRRPLSDLFEPAYTASLFESDDLQGVAYRHDRGAMYGFADGHARWIEKGWEKKEPVLWSLGEAGARGR
jgi:prepilin-type processing-associated H-X9-DG protein